MQSRLKDALGNTELTWLKREAKALGIQPDKNLSDSDQYHYLIEEMGNHGHSNVYDELKAKRREIVDNTRQNPENLMKWLYENQSTRLFGAENRLFVVLVDATDMEQSWKMNKGRAMSLNEPCNTVSAHLAKVSLNSTDPVFMVDERYRRFSTREAARIQSFPDTFKLDSVSQIRQYKAIGNAVPPVMMWHVIQSLKKVFAVHVVDFKEIKEVFSIQYESADSRNLPPAL